MDQHLLRIGSEFEVLLEFFAPLRQSGRLIRVAPQSDPRAEGGASGEAVLTVTAEHRETADDVIAGNHVRHVGPHLFHHSRRLVPEHGGQRTEEVTRLGVQVAVTDARGCGADQHLAGPGLVDLDVLDLEGLFHASQNRCLHGELSYGAATVGGGLRILHASTGPVKLDSDSDRGSGDRGRPPDRPGRER